MKQLIATCLIIVFISTTLFTIVRGSQTRQTNQTDTATPTLFYGDTCPHCHELLAWMNEQNIAAQTPVIIKEVYNNRLSALELTRAAQQCGLADDQVGVPFLAAKGECLVGKPDIQNYFITQMTPSDKSAP